MPPKIITQYDYENFEKPGVDFNPSEKTSRSKTIQSDMEAADINKIMARFEKTGVLIDPSGQERQPQYGDFTGLTDYHGMLSAVRQAERVFGLYPAKIRNRFDNDPQKFLDFMEDQKNDSEAVELGLKDRSILPLPPYWDNDKKLWKDTKTGVKLDNQPAAPVVPPGTPTA